MYSTPLVMGFFEKLGRKRRTDLLCRVLGVRILFFFLKRQATTQLGGLGDMGIAVLLAAVRHARFY